MIALALIGVLVIGGICAYGITYIVKNVLFNRSAKHYMYEQVRDVDGRWYKVVKLLTMMQPLLILLT